MQCKRISIGLGCRFLVHLHEGLSPFFILCVKSQQPRWFCLQSQVQRTQQPTSVLRLLSKHHNSFHTPVPQYFMTTRETTITFWNPTSTNGLLHQWRPTFSTKSSYFIQIFFLSFDITMLGILSGCIRGQLRFLGLDLLALVGFPCPELPPANEPSRTQSK